jgi:hypothetical protein
MCSEYLDTAPETARQRGGTNVVTFVLVWRSVLMTATRIPSLRLFLFVAFIAWKHFNYPGKTGTAKRSD